MTDWEKGEENMKWYYDHSNGSCIIALGLLKQSLHLLINKDSVV